MKRIVKCDLKICFLNATAPENYQQVFDVVWAMLSTMEMVAE